MGTGSTLLAARRRQRMSQEHLASVSGVSVRTIRRAETGAEISGESLRCLCAVLELQAQAIPNPAPETAAVNREPSSGFEPDHAVPTLTSAENAVSALLGAGTGLPIVTASLLVVTGSWTGADPLALTLIVLQSLAPCAAPALGNRFGLPARNILLGGVCVYLGVLSLIFFGGVSPRVLQVVQVAQLPIGIALLIIGMRAVHRGDRSAGGSDEGVGSCSG